MHIADVSRDAFLEVSSEKNGYLWRPITSIANKVYAAVVQPVKAKAPGLQISMLSRGLFTRVEVKNTFLFFCRVKGAWADKLGGYGVLPRSAGTSVLSGSIATQVYDWARANWR